MFCFLITYVKTLPRVNAEGDEITISNNSFAMVALEYRGLENTIFQVKYVLDSISLKFLSTSDIIS